jgi:hypothetical protein
MKAKVKTILESEDMVRVRLKANVPEVRRHPVTKDL